MQEGNTHVTDLAHLYTTTDLISTEHEVLEFFHALVRMVKPELVVELGTYTGEATEAIGTALFQNRRGRIESFDIDSSRIETAKNLLHAHLPIHLFCDDAVNAAKDYGDASVDIVLVDGGDDREREYRAWVPKVKAGGLILIHDALKGADTARWVLEERDLDINHHLVFRTPRGLAVFQVHEDLRRFAYAV